MNGDFETLLQIKELSSHGNVNINSTDVLLPDNLQQIGRMAFDLYFNLERVIFPNTLPSIGDWVFIFKKS